MSSFPFVLACLPMLVLGLFGAHAIADYGLQSAYMAEKKVRAPDNPDWFLALGAHALMHGSLVGVISMGFLLLTGSEPPVAMLIASTIGWTEAVAHFAIDHVKGRKSISYRTDQSLHYACKLTWAVILAGSAL